MNKAALDEIDWQIYHNWRLKLPEDKKEEIYASSFEDVSSRIDDYLAVNKLAIELTAKDLLENVLMKVRINWMKKEPTALEINRIVNDYTRKVKSTVDTKGSQNVAKNFVRNVFENEFGA